MKKIFGLIVMTLAANFLLLAGGVGWLFQSGQLNKAKIASIKEVIFPLEDPATTQPAEEIADPATQPILRLEELLARQAGRSATEQVEFIQSAFDSKMAELDRRQRELADLKRQVDLARGQLSKDRGELDVARGSLQQREELATQLERDQGFQDTLALYNTMPGKQVKTIFMSLDDDTVMKYLQAMQPRTAAKIIKEFKAPEEIARIQSVLEKMRQQQPAPDVQATAEQ